MTALDDIKARLRTLLIRGFLTYVYSNQADKPVYLQVRGLSGEVLDKIEHPEPYGFHARPLPGAEMIVGAMMGQRGQSVGLLAHDPRKRPQINNGETVVWSAFGNTVLLRDDGGITINAPSADVTVNAPKIIGNCQTAEINASTSATITAPITKIDGNLHVTGNVLADGQMQLGGEDGQPVARIGDFVNVGHGSSAGQHPIVTGSSKVTAS